ncbi:hypothetical protein GCM10027048_44900 [Hymenobacter coalescens]
MRTFWRAALLVGGAAMSGPVLGQRFVLPSGEYMDTTSRPNPKCPAAYPYYYSAQVKYPRSSATLLAQVRAHLGGRASAARSTGSGYVTFRFVVDCEGQPQPRVQVLQTDAGYRPTHFEPALVEALYAFVRSLREWPVATPRGGQAVNYIMVFSFKLSDGQIVAVLP